jgi:hypothetical protein
MCNSQPCLSIPKYCSKNARFDGMKVDIRLPQHFIEHLSLGDSIISNFDNSINQEIENAIKGKPLFSRYDALHFNAKIWWNDDLGYWCGEVWAYRKFVKSYLAETLGKLANEINSEYGKGE